MGQTTHTTNPSIRLRTRAEVRATIAALVAVLDHGEPDPDLDPGAEDEAEPELSEKLAAALAALPPMRQLRRATMHSCDPDGDKPVRMALFAMDHAGKVTLFKASAMVQPGTRFEGDGAYVADLFGEALVVRLATEADGRVSMALAGADLPFMWFSSALRLRAVLRGRVLASASRLNGVAAE